MQDNQLKYGIRLKTSKSLVMLEDWLDDHCANEWLLVLINMDDEMDVKDVEIRFQNATDKESFIAYYKGQPAEHHSAKASHTIM